MRRDEDVEVGIFFFSREVRLSLLGTAATVWLIVPASDDDDDDCGVIGGMRNDKGNRSTWKKPAPVPLYPPQIPHELSGSAAVGSRRLTA
jgi:hypothetical protein